MDQLARTSTAVERLEKEFSLHGEQRSNPCFHETISLAASTALVVYLCIRCSKRMIGDAPLIASLRSQLPENPSS